MNPVVHFEMPAENRQRMADFYSKTFGWKTQMLGKDMGNYVIATTTESDEKGPKSPARSMAAFSPRMMTCPHNIHRLSSRLMTSTTP